jgi:molybdenum cofactor cytidylyltransferase
MSPHILILAAGASTRLGQPKQLVRLGGRPALHRVIASATQVAGHDVTVVLGAHAKEMTYLLNRTSASWVINREWEQGLSSSLRAGLAALPPACEATLILLGDQVGVTAEDLRRLVDAWKGSESSIAASVYDRHVGVPAIFPHAYFSEMAELRGDQGARAILERNRDRLIRVKMPSAALDLDTPEQLSEVSERFKEERS